MISSQFIQSCQAGDEDSIQTLVRSYQRGVFQLALSIIDDGESVAPDVAPMSAPFQANTAISEAEKATRETFIAALDRLGRYREDTSFEIWLYSLAIRVSRRRYHRWKAQRFWARLFAPLLRPFAKKDETARWEYISHLGQGHEKAAPPPAESSGPGAAAGGEAAASSALHLLPGDAELWAAVRNLDEKMRLPVVLRYYHDFSIGDIARMLHVSEGAIHARLDAARERIAVGKN